MIQDVLQRLNGKDARVAPADFETQVHTKLAQLVALDAEIAVLEQRTAPLADLLAALIRHPVLWLLIGREGVDRPGGLGTIVGQQIITVKRHNTTALVLTAIGMLLLGVLLGIGGMLLWIGGV
jgi:hypothetical protein